MKKRILTTRDLILCALFSALIGVGAFIRVPVPMMDYFTLQFLFVLMAGFLLGPRLGAVSVAVYVLIGLAGVPVFAAGGGILYVVRPSFGYLLGFVASAWVVGLCAERAKDPGLGQYIAIALLGMAATYVIGFGYKYLILNLYLGEPTALLAIMLASLPLDIPGDLLLCVVSAALTVRLGKTLRKGAPYDPATQTADN